MARSTFVANPDILQPATLRWELRLAFGKDLGKDRPSMSPVSSSQTWVNDVHSECNATCVSGVFAPTNGEELRKFVLGAGERAEPFSVAGCRHAMGGQQFLSGGVLLDLRGMREVLDFSPEEGLLRVEAGIQWPEVIASYRSRETKGVPQWSIAQKQTGADTFTLGGSLSANIHGRGLSMAPLIADVEEFSLLGADGELRVCSREKNPELFALGIGGYGLFGVIVDVTLRLVPRRRLERLVKILRIGELAEALGEKRSEGCLYGDFQFSIDERSEDFLRLGVFSCYRPTDRPLPAGEQLGMRDEDWIEMLSLAFTDRARVFEKYSQFYLATHGQVYESDLQQLGPYLPDYSRKIVNGGLVAGASRLMISELYVPPERLVDFLSQAARLLREAKTNVIYGTVRWIQEDRESFLPWARRDFACVIFNLPVGTGEKDFANLKLAFLGLIDLAAAMGGSFYLTYHRFADPARILKCHPGFENFLRKKWEWDPGGLFQSDWFRQVNGDFCALHGGKHPSESAEPNGAL